MVLEKDFVLLKCNTCRLIFTKKNKFLGHLQQIQRVSGCFHSSPWKNVHWLKMGTEQRAIVSTFENPNLHGSVFLTRRFHSFQANIRYRADVQHAPCCKRKDIWRSGKEKHLLGREKKKNIAHAIKVYLLAKIKKKILQPGCRKTSHIWQVALQIKHLGSVPKKTINKAGLGCQKEALTTRAGASTTAQKELDAHSPPLGFEHISQKSPSIWFQERSEGRK